MIRVERHTSRLRYTSLGSGASLVVLLASAPAFGAAPAVPAETRDHQDLAILKLLEHRYPGASQELERGEALLRSGEPAKAAALFAELAKKSPEGAWRRGANARRSPCSDAETKRWLLVARPTLASSPPRRCEPRSQR